MALPLEELLAIERGDDVSNADLPNVSSLLRRRLLRGDKLNAQEVARDYQVSNGLLAQVVSQFAGIGFEVEVSDGENGLRYHALADPDQPFDAAKIEAYRVRRDLGQKASAERRREAKAAKVKEAEGRASAKAKAKTKTKSKTTEMATNGTVAPPIPVDRVSVEGPPHPPLPALGTNLRVYLIAEEEDGSVVVGLANGSAKWLATVTGFTKVS